MRSRALASVAGDQAEQSVQDEVELAAGEWPVAIIRMPRTVGLDASLRFGRTVEELIARKQDFVLVIDHRPTVRMDAAARKAIAEWEKSRAASLKTFAKALAIVMPNRAMFAVATLITWLNPPPYPKKCFIPEEWESAKAWARNHL
jgi:hypothetical protein